MPPASHRTAPRPAQGPGKGDGQRDRAIWWAIRRLEEQVVFLMSRVQAPVPPRRRAGVGAFAREGNAPPAPAVVGVGRAAARQGGGHAPSEAREPLTSKDAAAVASPGLEGAGGSDCRNS
jgi:hypothetical protein